MQRTQRLQLVWALGSLDVELTGDWEVRHGEDAVDRQQITTQHNISFHSWIKRVPERKKKGKSQHGEHPNQKVKHWIHQPCTHVVMLRHYWRLVVNNQQLWKRSDQGQVMFAIISLIWERWLLTIAEESLYEFTAHLSLCASGLRLSGRGWRKVSDM